MASAGVREHAARAGGRGSQVEDGTRQGIFRGLDPHLVAEVFIGAYRRVSQPDFLAESDLSMAEAYAELSRLLRHGLLHPEKSLRVKRFRPAADRPA